MIGNVRRILGKFFDSARKTSGNFSENSRQLFSKRNKVSLWTESLTISYFISFCLQGNPGDAGPRGGTGRPVGQTSI